MDTSSPRVQQALIAVTIALGLVTVAGVWFFSDSRAAASAHDAARERWEAREPASYAFDWSRCSGMCPYCLLRVTVTDGQVADVVRREGDCSDYDVDTAPTVEQVFEMEAGDREAEWTDSFEISYDPVWGFPASVSIECPPGTADCGIGYSVVDFEVLAGRGE